MSEKLARRQGARSGRKEAELGFTLVEMAIVLVIIGLIVGGILKGAEIVNQGHVKTQVAQIDSIRAAVSTFQDEFGFYPGDYKASSTWTPGNFSFDGDENGIVNTPGSISAAADSGSVGSEMGFAWVQLAFANLLGGAVTTDTGTAYPGKMSASYLIYGDFTYQSTNSTVYATGGASLSGKYVRIQGNAAATTGVPTAVLRVQDASTIDSKYDDGDPTSGSVLASGASNANCITSGYSSTQYNTTGAATVLACVLMWKIE